MIKNISNLLKDNRQLTKRPKTDIAALIAFLV